MTSQEATQLQQYRDAFDSTKAAYEQELSYNNTGHTYAAQSYWVKPYNNQATDQADFMGWLSNSDASLSSKKTQYLSAQAALDNFQKQLDASALNSAIASNPNLLVDIAKTKSDTALASQKQILAQGTTKYLIWGVTAILLLTIGIYIWKKKYAKA